jgi:hypothetical protein
MSRTTVAELAKRVDAIEAHLEEIAIIPHVHGLASWDHHHAEGDNYHDHPVEEPRIVQVKFLSEYGITDIAALEAQQAYDYIDALGDLEVGERVQAGGKYGTRVAMVVAVNGERTYGGRLWKIEERA